MKDLNQFTCPCCGAKLVYDGEKEMMKCPYCEKRGFHKKVVSKKKG